MSNVQRGRAELGRFEIANRASGAQLFGLVAVRTFLGCPELDGAEVKVRFADQEASFPAVELATNIGENRWLLTFHINTHLAANGAHDLDMSVIWPDEQVRMETARYTVRNEGRLAEEVAADLRDYGAKLIVGAEIDSGMFPYASGASKIWFDQQVAPDIPLSAEPAESEETALAHLHRWGFCVLNETLPKPMIDRFLIDLNVAIDSNEIAYNRGSSDRIHNAHRMASGRDIWLYPPVLKFLEKQFRDTPCACQTLTYVNGSEQAAHQDTIHLTPYPAGYMCGVWIALQDVQPESGELFVYPGSHKSKRLRAAELGLDKVKEDYSSYVVFDKAIRDILEEEGYERLIYRPKAGQILVWSENLIHGGSHRSNRDITRNSIVSHYFAKGSVAYYDSRGEAAGLESII